MKRDTYMSIIKHMRNSKRLAVCFSTWTLEKQGGTCARFQLLKPYRLDATLKLLTRWFLQSQQKISSWKPPRAWKIYENHVTEPRHLRILLWFFPKGFIMMECSPLSQIEFRLDDMLKLLTRCLSADGQQTVNRQSADSQPTGLMLR